MRLSVFTMRRFNLNFEFTGKKVENCYEKFDGLNYTDRLHYTFAICNVTFIRIGCSYRYVWPTIRYKYRM
jgi:hypothetical protein